MFLVETLAYHLKRSGLDLSRSGWRVILVHVAIIGVFGIWWPYVKGIEFLDPVLLSAYACLGVVFAGPAAAQGLAKDPPRTMREALTRIAIAALYGEMMAVLILGSGLTTVYSLRKILFGPDWSGLAWAGALGLTGAIAMAAVAAWIALRFSASVARGALRLIFFGLLCLFFFKSRWLPEIAARGILFCSGVAILSFFGIRRALMARD
jgi:hypothetical protein